MIPVWRVAAIRGLLVEGELSQRKIAERVGVSRGTVAAIALGRRPDYADRRQAGCGSFSPAGEFVPPSGPAQRCPGCGGMVQMPCLVCRVRRLQQRQPINPRCCC
jgi:hypothetical protein